MAQDNFLNETGLAQFATEFHDRLETEIGNDNLIDTFHVTQQVYNGYQIDDGVLFTLNNTRKNTNGLSSSDYFYSLTDTTDSNKRSIFTKDGYINASFQLALVEKLKKNTTYTLSFDCSGVPSSTVRNGVPMKFYISHAATATGYYAYFLLENGRVTTTFTTTESSAWSVNGNDSLPALYVAASKDNNGTEMWYPDAGNPQSIRLTNFILKEGQYTSESVESISTVANVVEDRITNNSSVKSGNWSVNVTDDAFIDATRLVYFTSADYGRYPPIENTGTYTSGVKYAGPYYIDLPYAMRKTSVSGTADTNGRYVSNINFLYPSGDDSSWAQVGMSFYVIDPSGYTGTRGIALNLHVSGEAWHPNQNPYFTNVLTFDPTIASQIVAVAESYIKARNNGRQFFYGVNPVYIDETIVNRTIYRYQTSNTYEYEKWQSSSGESSAAAENYYPWRRNAGMMECDTLGGLVLRGIPYDQSPYTNTDIAFRYGYDDLYLDTTAYPNGVQSVPTWSSTTTYTTGQYVKITTNPHSSDTYAANTSTIPGVSTRYWYYKSKSSSNKNHQPPNTTYWEEVWLANPNNLGWASNLNTYIKNPANNYLLHDVRYASEQEWMFWPRKKKVGTVTTEGNYYSLFEDSNLFTSTTKVRAGDFAFWRKPGYSKASFFDSVTHVAVVGYDSNTETTEISSTPDFWVYEMTGMNNSSGYCLNKRKMSSFKNLPTRFARPYGFEL